jgi:hypothetical protein
LDLDRKSSCRIDSAPSDAAAKNDTEDFSVYDKVTTRIVPIFALAWSETDDVGWSDARIMCMSIPNVTKGNREAPGVPSGVGRLRVDGLAMAGGVVMLMLFQL